MTDSTDPIEPDVVIRTALQLLPIPPHDDEFWTSLESALDAEPPLEMPVEPPRRVLVADPSPVPAPAPVELEDDRSLAIVPAAFRRPTNAVLAVIAAAAVVVVAIAGSTLLDDQHGSVQSGDADEATAALETLVRDAQANGTVTTLSSGDADASSAAVLGWVDDLSAGDAEDAWAAMGESSRSHFGTPDEFEAVMTDLAEGYGAWAAAEPEQVLVTPLATGDDGTIAVVTLVGTVEQEGVPQERADAFPVRIVDDEVVVEPFASAGELEVAVPELTSDDALERETVMLQEELVFVLPSGAEAPVVRIDDGDAVVCGEAPGTELSDLDQSPGQRCAYLPEGGFTAGDHIVTIAFEGSDGGSITAESFQFAAA